MVSSISRKKIVPNKLLLNPKKKMKLWNYMKTEKFTLTIISEKINGVTSKTPNKETESNSTNHKLLLILQCSWTHLWCKDLTQWYLESTETCQSDHHLCQDSNKWSPTSCINNSTKFLLMDNSKDPRIMLTTHNNLTISINNKVREWTRTQPKIIRTKITNRDINNNERIKMDNKMPLFKLDKLLCHNKHKKFNTLVKI